MRRITTTLALASSIALPLAAATAQEAAASTKPIQVTRSNYVHFPGRSYETSQQCSTALNNFKAAVKRSGGVLGGRGITPDSELSTCFLASNGWSYDLGYSATKPFFTQDMKLKGGFAMGTIEGGMRLTKAQAQYFDQFQATTFTTGKAFNSLSQCKAEFAKVDGKLKAAVRAGTMLYNTPAADNSQDPSAPSGVSRWPWHSCSSDLMGDPPRNTFSYQVSYTASTKGKTPIPGAATSSRAIFNPVWWDDQGQHFLPQVNRQGVVQADGSWKLVKAIPAN